MKKVISSVGSAVCLQLALCLYVGVLMPLMARSLIGDVMKYRWEGDAAYALCALGCTMAAGLFVLLRFILKSRGWWHPSGTFVFHGLSAAALITAAVIGFLAFRRDFADSTVFLFSGEGKGTLYSMFFLFMFFTYGVLAFIDALCAIRKSLSSCRLRAKAAAVLHAVLYQALIVFWIIFCYLLLHFLDFRVLHGSGLGSFLNFLFLDGLLALFGVVLLLVLFSADRRRMKKQGRWHRSGTIVFHGISLAILAVPTIVVFWAYIVDVVQTFAYEIEHMRSIGIFLMELLLWGPLLLLQTYALASPFSAFGCHFVILFLDLIALLRERKAKRRAASVDMPSDENTPPADPEPCRSGEATTPKD